MGKLNIVVLYDRWEEPEESDAVASDKAPLTRTLDKKEVEDEVADALGKLGHDADAARARRIRSRACTRWRGWIAIWSSTSPNRSPATIPPTTASPPTSSCSSKRFTGSGSHGLLYAQDKAVAKKILEFHGIHTPVFARSYRGRLDFSHDLEFPVIVKPAREDGSIGIEFNAVVSSIRELMERIDWLHANFDSPVLIEEYVEGREMYVGVIGNENPTALPPVELDLSKLPEGTPRIAGAEVKWGKGTGAYRDTKSAVAEDLPEETVDPAADHRHCGLSGARAARLRPHRHAPASRRSGRRHRSQPESLAGVEGGVRDGRPQGRTHLHAADRGDRRHRAGARIRAPEHGRSDVALQLARLTFHDQPCHEQYSRFQPLVTPRTLVKRSILSAGQVGPMLKACETMRDPGLQLSWSGSGAAGVRRREQIERHDRRL